MIPSHSRIEKYFKDQGCHVCKPSGKLEVSFVGADFCNAKCCTCGLLTSAPNKTIQQGSGIISTEVVRVSKDNKIFYKEREIKQWKASPNPYSPTNPRMLLTFSDGETSNITGQDAGDIWKAVQGQQYAGQKAQSSASVRASKNAIIQGIASDAYLTKKKDLMFEKLKKFKPGTVVSLSRGRDYVGKTESQDFMVQKLYEEDCSILMSPVKGNKVSDVTAIFTAEELKKFTVTIRGTDGWDLLPQQDQVLPKGKFVTVQGYYEQWE